jgi:hypothetical protein
MGSNRALMREEVGHDSQDVPIGWGGRAVGGAVAAAEPAKNDCRTDRLVRREWSDVCVRELFERRRERGRLGRRQLQGGYRATHPNFAAEVDVRLRERVRRVGGRLRSRARARRRDDRERKG